MVLPRVLRSSPRRERKGFGQVNRTGPGLGLSIRSVGLHWFSIALLLEGQGNDVGHSVLVHLRRRELARNYESRNQLTLIGLVL